MLIAHVVPTQIALKTLRFRDLVEPDERGVSDGLESVVQYTNRPCHWSEYARMLVLKSEQKIEGGGERPVQEKLFCGRNEIRPPELHVAHIGRDIWIPRG